MTLQWKPEKHLAKVRRTVIVQVFANWIVFALEKVLLSMCQNSRVIVFRFYSKTQWQMFLLFYGRNVGAPRKGTNMASQYKLYKFGWNSFPKHAGMKLYTDLNLGEVVYISIIYHIPDSRLNLLNGYDFHFRCKPPIFRCPQNGILRCTKSSNLSGEELFLLSTAAKT